jgi:hypothetical protein
MLNESTVGDFGKSDLVLKDLIMKGDSMSQTFIESEQKPS